MYTFKLRLLSVFMLACLLAALPGSRVQARDSIIYVDQDAIHGLNNGTSWKDAYIRLEFALADAASSDVIYVAEGTYKPTNSTDRTATFQLQEGVEIYGGFAGTEFYVTQRHPLTHVTILSGDIGTPDVSTDNSYHVVTANTSGYARLEGFTITGGNANLVESGQVGGGLIRLDGVGGPTLTLDHVIFRNNSAFSNGGGIYNEEGGLTLDQVTFEENGATRGGGLYNSGTVMLTGATFQGNSAGTGGGLFSNGQAAVSNSTFYDNHATNTDGGAIFSNTSLTVLFSTFSHNSAAGQGAAVYNTSGEVTLHNSILANSLSGVDCYNAGSISASYNLIEDNSSGANACGIPLLTVDPNLGPLHNNGRFTQTMALIAGSPALEAADDAACPETDQRGMARTQGVHCDLGAFELAETPPGAATLSRPSGSLDPGTLIEFRWDEVTSATWYYLWVNGPSGNILKQWYSADQACHSPGCGIHLTGITWSSGTYTWWVQTWNEAGYGPWSSGMTFTIPAPPLPGKVTLVSPALATGVKTPTYTWNEDSEATWYYLWVNGPSGNVHKQWYEAVDICSWGSCSITPAITLSTGNYSWWVQTWNAAGYGPWSDRMDFSFALPGKARLNAPIGISFTIMPTYNWNEVPGATWYYLWVNTSSGGNVVKKWYTASTICSGGFCQATPITPPLINGTSYTWWVQTYNSAGYGPWSDPLSFTVTSP